MFYVKNYQPMDNLDRLLDAIEHPEAYTPEELDDILNDAEAAEALHILDDAKAALADVPEPDTDAEWAAFSKKYSRKLPLQRRAVAAILIAVASAAAVATGLGVYRSSQAVRHDLVAEDTAKVIEVSATDAIRSLPATAPSVAIFENVPLEDILSDISQVYGTEVVFKSDSARGLRLFFRWDTNLTAAEVVELLNNFEQIDIHIEGRTITVE